MNTNSGARTNSGELPAIWREVVGLASAVGDLRGRVTRLERLEERRQWEASMGTAYGSQQAEPQESLLQRIFRFREMIEALVAIVRVARALPWGIITLAAVSAWKWAWPIARDTGSAFLRWLGL